MKLKVMASCRTLTVVAAALGGGETQGWRIGGFKSKMGVRVHTPGLLGGLRGFSRKAAESTTMEEITFSEQQEMKAIRMAKVEDMRKAGVNPYAYCWRVTHRGEDLIKGWDSLKPGEEELNSNVSVAG
eukprot:418845_1